MSCGEQARQRGTIGVYIDVDVDVDVDVMLTFNPNAGRFQGWCSLDGTVKIANTTLN